MLGLQKGTTTPLLNTLEIFVFNRCACGMCVAYMCVFMCVEITGHRLLLIVFRPVACHLVCQTSLQKVSRLYILSAGRNECWVKDNSHHTRSIRVLGFCT